MTSWADLFYKRRYQRWLRLTKRQSLPNQRRIKMSTVIADLPRVDSEPEVEANWTLMERKPKKYTIDIGGNSKHITFYIRKKNHG